MNEGNQHPLAKSKVKGTSDMSGQTNGFSYQFNQLNSGTGGEQSFNVSRSVEVDCIPGGSDSQTQPARRSPTNAGQPYAYPTAWYNPVMNYGSSSLPCTGAPPNFDNRNAVAVAQSQQSMHSMLGNAIAEGRRGSPNGYAMPNYFFNVNSRNETQPNQYLAAWQMQLPKEGDKQYNYANFLQAPVEKDDKQVFLYKYMSVNPVLMRQAAGMQSPVTADNGSNTLPAIGKGMNATRDPVTDSLSSTKRKAITVAEGESRKQVSTRNEDSSNEFGKNADQRGQNQQQDLSKGKKASKLTQSLASSQKGKKSKVVAKKPKREQSSKYRGVCWHKRYKSWVSRLSVNGKSMHLGIFENEIAAALAVDKKLIALHGEKATKLNFPDPLTRKRLKEQLLNDPKLVNSGLKTPSH